MPRPLYSGATLTLDTPAIGTGRPRHHWRMPGKAAAAAGVPPTKAPRDRPPATSRERARGHRAPAASARRGAAGSGEDDPPDPHRGMSRRGKEMGSPFGI